MAMIDLTMNFDPILAVKISMKKKRKNKKLKRKYDHDPGTLDLPDKFLRSARSIVIIFD